MEDSPSCIIAQKIFWIDFLEGIDNSYDVCTNVFTWTQSYYKKYRSDYSKVNIRQAFSILILLFFVLDFWKVQDASSENNE